MVPVLGRMGSAGSSAVWARLWQGPSRSEQWVEHLRGGWAPSNSVLLNSVSEGVGNGGRGHTCKSRHRDPCIVTHTAGRKVRGKESVSSTSGTGLYLASACIWSKSCVSLRCFLVYFWLQWYVELANFLGPSSVTWVLIPWRPGNLWWFYWRVEYKQIGSIMVLQG